MLVDDMRAACCGGVARAGGAVHITCRRHVSLNGMSRILSLVFTAPYPTQVYDKTADRFLSARLLDVFSSFCS
jgi:hypothetical protein